MENIQNDGEKVLWEGRQNLASVMIRALFNWLAIVLILWFIVIEKITYFSTQPGTEQGNTGSYAYVLTIITLLFLGIYFVNVLYVWMKLRIVKYTVTDKAVYIKSGIITTVTESKPYIDVSRISLTTTFFDKALGTGTITFECGHGAIHLFRIQNIKDYKKVFELINKYQQSIFD